MSPGLRTSLAGHHHTRPEPPNSLSATNYKQEVWPELQSLLTNTQTDREFLNFGHTAPPFPSRPGTTRRLFEIHGGREQTKHFPQRQNKTLWLQQWPHNRPSSNGPFAFRWKERNEVIWTCGPNGGAAVKHLTIKQLNCAAAVSLSGKLIQRAVRMIPFIRDEKSHAPSQSIYIPSQSDTLPSVSSIKASREK